ncbi:hypothetical protein R1sor_027337 [Riccia sorocarpa]|uniref:Uncharacterized protein n=1 Tax=Riccia sorocarpa TaxID=122646 RepID=A0ABD3GJN5_9MARC
MESLTIGFQSSELRRQQQLELEKSRVPSVARSKRQSEFARFIERGLCRCAYTVSAIFLQDHFGGFQGSWASRIRLGEKFEVQEYVHKGFGVSEAQHDAGGEFVRVSARRRSWVGSNGVFIVGLKTQVVEEMQMVNNCVVGYRTRVMAQVGARVLGRGLVRQWHREVCVRMASTALIFSALQPVRPALHLPYRQQVMPGRVARENGTNLLLLRQCATTEPSYGAANSVLLETRECADGSIMYKFGSAEQKEAMSIASEQLIPKAAELNEVPAELQSVELNSEAGDHRQAATPQGEASEGESSGTSHPTESSIPEVETAEIEQKLADSRLEQQHESSAREDVSQRREVSVSNSDSAPTPGTVRLGKKHLTAVGILLRFLRINYFLFVISFSHFGLERKVFQ